jgi:hypothetical protein
MESPTEDGCDALIWEWAVIPADILALSIICCERGPICPNFSSIGQIVSDHCFGALIEQARGVHLLANDDLLTVNCCLITAALAE